MLIFLHVLVPCCFTLYLFLKKSLLYNLVQCMFGLDNAGFDRGNLWVIFAKILLVKEQNVWITGIVLCKWYNSIVYVNDAFYSMKYASWSCQVSLHLSNFVDISVISIVVFAAEFCLLATLDLDSVWLINFCLYGVWEISEIHKGY